MSASEASPTPFFLARLDRAWELADASWRVGPVAALAFAALMAQAMPWGPVACWAGLTLVAHLGGPVGARLHQRGTAPGRSYRRLKLVMLNIGVSWAAGLLYASGLHRR